MKNSLNANLTESTTDFTKLIFSDRDEDFVTFADINVPPDSFFRIEFESFAIGRLTMGANSALIINPSLRYSNIVISSAFLDGDVVIGVEGHTSPDATPNTSDPWRSGWWQAGGGQNGQQGYSGLNGGHGQHAISIKLKIGVNTLANSLTVISKGGDGGNGSNGGKGQIGGNGSSPFRHCGYGGNGGKGGNGGNGGNGGDINVEFYKNANFTGQIILSSKGGSFGEAGNGGAFGEGGGGCLRGEPGNGGVIGAPGTDGVTIINEIPRP